jgi:GNAT superfamily N-acetyltransferase
LITASFSIRRAEGIERRSVVRQLLPHPAQDGADIFVAAEADNPKPIGAAAIWFTPSRHFPETGNFVLHVAEAQRRRGAGRALLESLISAARDIGAKQLKTSPLEEQSAGFQFLLVCGFEFGAPTITCEAPIEDFANLLRPLHDRLEKRGKIPAGGRVLPLSQVPGENVCRLMIDYLGFPSEAVAERFRSTEHGFSQTLSRVALLDGKIVGAFLITYQKAVATIEATAVLPAHRHSWVNVALRFSAVEEGLARGVERIRFSANGNLHRDTVNHAARIKARVLKTIRQPTFNLTS